MYFVIYEGLIIVNNEKQLIYYSIHCIIYNFLKNNIVDNKKGR